MEPPLTGSGCACIELVRKHYEKLDAALNYYQDFIREYGNDPQLQADVAAAHLRVAQITYMNGGSSNQWFPRAREGVEIIGRLVEAEEGEQIGHIFSTQQVLDPFGHHRELA